MLPISQIFGLFKIGKSNWVKKRDFPNFCFILNLGRGGLGLGLGFVLGLAPSMLGNGNGYGNQIGEWAKRTEFFLPPPLT